MKIRELVSLEDKRDKFSVLFDDGADIKVTYAQIADFGLYSGRELSDDEYAQLRDDLELSTAKSRALRILGSRNMSAFDISKRLIDKGTSRETAQKTVQWLEKIGAVNDEAYAEMIASHYSAQGYGLAKIKDELYRRGVARDLWEDALEAVGDTSGAVNAFLGKKLTSNSDTSDIRRTVGALQRRGFGYSEAKEAVDRYMENLDEPV